MKTATVLFEDEPVTPPNAELLIRKFPPYTQLTLALKSGANLVGTADVDIITFRATGNVGIGTTSPNAKLEVVSPFRITRGASSGGAGYQFTQAPNDTYLRLSYFNTATNEYTPNILAATYTGNVGIGTTGPLGKLDIRPNASWNTSTGIILDQSGDANPAIKLYRTNGGSPTPISFPWHIRVGSSAVNNLEFATGAGVAMGSETVSAKMVLDASGNVGIGTTGPASTLHVNGTIVGGTGTPTAGDIGSRSMILTARPGGTYSSLGFETGSTYKGDFDFTGNTGDMRWWLWNGSAWTNTVSILGSGNVGIGTTSPSAPLEVAFSGLVGFNVGFAAGVYPNYNRVFWASDGTGYGLTFANRVSGTYYDRVVIKDNGNVGIGTTGPNQKLHVNGNTKIIGTDAAWAENLCLIKSSGWGGVRFARYDPALGNYDGNWAIGYNAATGNDFSISNNVGGTQYDGLFHIKQNGNVGIGTTGPGAKLEISGVNGTVYNQWTYSPEPTVYNLKLTEGTQPSDVYWYFTQRNANTDYNVLTFRQGNVGIGTTGPAGQLHVYTTATPTSGQVIFTTYTGAKSQSLYIAPGVRLNGSYPWVADSSVVSLTGTGTSAMDLAFGSGNTELMRIKTSGNVGIGTTGPGANLDVKITSNGIATMNLGTSSTGYDNGGAIHFFGAGNADLSYIMGGYGPSGNNLGYIKFVTNYPTNGTEVMRITGSNVGIGTTAPLAKLHAQGTNARIIIGDNLGSVPAQGYVWGQLDFKGRTSESSNMAMGRITVNNDNATYGDRGYMAFFTADGTTWDNTAVKERARITSLGNVGIGTTGPANILDIRGTSPTVTVGTNADSQQATLWLRWTSGATTGMKMWYDTLSAVSYFDSMYAATSGRVWGDINFRTSASGTPQSLLYLKNSTGNVGIGTVSPDRSLTIANTTGANYINVKDGTREILMGVDSTSPGMGIISVMSVGHDLALRAGGNSEKVRIQASGNVGIGTTGPSRLLDVYGTGAWNGTGGIRLQGSNPGIEITDTVSGQRWLIANGVSSGNDGKWGLAYDITHGRHNIVVDISGNVGIGTTGPNAMLSVGQEASVGTPEVRIGWGLTDNQNRLTIYSSAGYNMGLRRGSRDLRIFAKSPDGDGNIYLMPNDVIAMTLLSSGNVGIGTSGPSDKLDIIGAVRSYGVGKGFVVLNTSTDVSSWGSPWYGVGLANIDLGGGANSTVSLQGYYGIGLQTASGIMVMKQSGNVGIGTAGPATKLYVEAGSIFVNGESQGVIVDAGGLQRVGFVKYPGYEGALMSTGPSLRFGHVTSGTLLSPTTFNVDMLINSTGNVGIGTTGPSQKLQTTGNTILGDTRDSYVLVGNNQYGTNPATQFNPGFYVYRGGGGVDYGMKLQLDATGYSTAIFASNQGNRYITFGRLTGESADNQFVEKMRIDVNSGNVGIGTTGPVTKLDLGGSGNIGLGVYSGVKAQYIGLYGSGGSFADNSGTGNIYFQTLSDGASNAIGFVTHHSGVSDTTRMYIDRDGNVGIGTVNPGAKLSVMDPTNTAYWQLRVGYVDSTYDFGIGRRPDNGALQIQGTQTGYNNIALAPTSGNVGIGTTGPEATLTIDGSSPVLVLRSGAPLRLRPGNNAYNWDIKAIGNDVQFIDGGLGTMVTIKQGGNVGIGTTGPESQLQIGSPYPGTTGVMPLVRFIGTPQSSTESTLLRLTRGVNAGPHYAGSADFKMKAYSDASNAPYTQLTLTLKSGANLVETADVDVITFRDTGNVGIGTTNPGGLLELRKDSIDLIRISGSATSNIGAMSFYSNGSPNQRMILRGLQGFGLYVGSDWSAEKIRIDSTGNVGIGTTGPQALLHVGSLSGATQAYGDYPALFVSKPTQHTVPTAEIKHSPGNPGCGGCQNIALKIGVTDNQGSSKQNIGLWVDANNAASNYAAIFNTGNVGIGTTGPNTKLEVSATGQTRLRVTTTSTTDNEPKIELSSNYNNNAERNWQLTTSRSAMGTFEIRSSNVAGGDPYAGGGTTRLLINSSGNVGIGTTGPASKLHIYSTTAAAEEMFTLDKHAGWSNFLNALQSIKWRDASNVVGAIGARYDGTSVNFDFHSLYNSGYKTESDVVMTIKGSGNVGIGTTGPQASLDVVNTTNDSGSTLRIQRGGTGYNFTRDANTGFLKIWGEQTGYIGYSFNTASSTNLVTINNSGNVGIGTTGPFSKTTITKVGVSAFTTADATNNAHLTLAGLDSLVRLQFGTMNVSPWSGMIQASYDNGGGANGTESLSLNPLGGNVGIGTTGPWANLHVAQNDGAADSVRAPIIVSRWWANSTDTRAGAMYSYYNSTTANDQLVFGVTGGGGLLTSPALYSNAKMVIQGNGNVGIGTTGPGDKLEVDGVTSKLIVNTVYGGGLRFIDTRATGRDWAVQVSETQYQAAGVAGTFNIVDVTNNRSVVSFNTTGNVGIGTTSPNDKLEVVALNSAVGIGGMLAGAQTGLVFLNYGVKHVGFRYDGNGNLIFEDASAAVNPSSWYSNSTANFLVRNGNVGIGTTNPYRNLEIRTGRFGFNSAAGLASTKIGGIEADNSYRDGRDVSAAAIDFYSSGS